MKTMSDSDSNMINDILSHNKNDIHLYIGNVDTISNMNYGDIIMYFIDRIQKTTNKHVHITTYSSMTKQSDNDCIGTILNHISDDENRIEENSFIIADTTLITNGINKHRDCINTETYNNSFFIGTNDCKTYKIINKD